MKYIITSLLLISLFNTKGNAQETSVENSLWGIQLGVHPLSGYNERKLTNDIALRGELGWGFAYSVGEWGIIPVIVLEPRYYYNLKKRSDKNKRIDMNSGNYLSLYLGVEPGLGITSENADLRPGMASILMYGLRRNIGKHFNFETAFGLGYGWRFDKYTSIDGSTGINTEHGVSFGMRLALGYVF